MISVEIYANPRVDNFEITGYNFARGNFLP